MLMTLQYIVLVRILMNLHTMQRCVVAIDMVVAIREWYDNMNRLVISRTKPNVILVTTRQLISGIYDTDLIVHIRDHKLRQCTNIAYFVVEIDCTLSWDSQIDLICKKLVFIVSRLSRFKAVIPLYLLLLVCI